MPGTLHGIILAGGISSRMGFPKALTPIGDTFFLHAVYRELIGAGISPVHIVVNSGLHSTMRAQESKFSEGHFVDNREPNLGQFHSLKLGLSSIDQKSAAGAVVALVDLPAVNPETIRALAGRAAAAPDKIIIPRHQNQHGHPYIIPVTLFPLFLDSADGQTARDVQHTLTEKTEYLDVDDPNILHDIDSPADLAAQSKDPDMD